MTPLLGYRESPAEQAGLGPPRFALVVGSGIRRLWYTPMRRGGDSVAKRERLLGSRPDDTGIQRDGVAMRDANGTDAVDLLAMAVVLFILAALAWRCTPLPPVVPVIDGGDAGAISCAVPGDPPACACQVLAAAGCHEADPTALGETCEVGSKARLAVSYAHNIEARSVECIVAARSVAELRSRCEVCR
jgi:hypothetical protein